MHVLPKPLQIQISKQAFTNLNPNADPYTVDFDAYIDPELSLPENLDVLEKTYPTYQWRKEESDNPMVEETTKYLTGLRNSGVTERQIVSIFKENGFDLEKPSSQCLTEAQHTIRLLQEELEAKKNVENKSDSSDYDHLMKIVFPPLPLIGITPDGENYLSPPPIGNEIIQITILLYGTVGAGKSELANTIAQEACTRYPNLVNCRQSQSDLYRLMRYGFGEEGTNAHPINILFLDDLTHAPTKNKHLPFLFKMRHIMTEVTGYKRGLIVLILGLHDLYGVKKTLRVEPEIIFWRSMPTNKFDKKDTENQLGEPIARKYNEIVFNRRFESPHDSKLWPWTAFKTRMKTGLVEMPKIDSRLYKEA